MMSEQSVSQTQTETVLETDVTDSVSQVRHYSDMTENNHFDHTIRVTR